MPHDHSPILSFATLATALLGMSCTPSIGDKCALSTDCSLQGDRLCDTSQPGGYCTIFNCTTNSCPESTCVLYNANVQGCAYDDRNPSRTARSFCLAQCTSSSDCRDGYECADPRSPPWNALILDDDQTQRVCVVPPTEGGGANTPPIDADAAVCQPNAPPTPPLDAGPSDAAAADASSEGG